MKRPVLIIVIFSSLLVSLDLVYAADPAKPNAIAADVPGMADEAGVRRDGLLRSYLATPPSLKADAPIWSYCNFPPAAYWLKERMPEVADFLNIDYTAIQSNHQD